MPSTGFTTSGLSRGVHAISLTVRDGDGRDFQWTPEVEKKLHEGVGEILELDDEAKQNCELIHFEMDEGGADAKRRMHYLVVYHPGKMKLLRQPSFAYKRLAS